MRLIMIQKSICGNNRYDWCGEHQGRISFLVVFTRDSETKVVAGRIGKIWSGLQ